MAETYYSMTELIKLTDTLVAATPTTFYNGIMAVRGGLASIPAADVVPVVHGRWIDMGDFISCSLCSATRMKEFLCDYGVARRLDVRTNYCPNCGARMEG